ncbi:MAG TPA: translation initiation factor IF-2 N-terminal domain-containing protein, partial [Polyangia bacterium]|nr:translation initiation factor IF-2 N-terminal domain-containing protein [Polyangia bacterium]
MMGSGYNTTDTPAAPRVRIYELAKELALGHREMVAKVRSLGIEVANHMSHLEPADVDRVRRAVDRERKESTFEERITADGTVIRRRSKAVTAAPAAAPAAAKPAAPAPVVVAKAPAPAPVEIAEPAPAPKRVVVAPPPVVVEEAPAPAVAKAPVVEAPKPVAAPEPEPAPVVEKVEAPAPAASTLP